MATAAGRLVEGVTAVRDVSPLALGVVFTIAGSAALGSDTQHSVVAAEMVDSVEDDDSVFGAVHGDGVSGAGDANCLPHTPQLSALSERVLWTGLMVLLIFQVTVVTRLSSNPFTARGNWALHPDMRTLIKTLSHSRRP